MTPVPFDPRPRCVTSDGTARARGQRCVECRYPTFTRALRCPLCAGRLRDDYFGPGGVVFASTRMHIGLPDREPPYSLAYVVFDDGPRALVHTLSTTPVPIGHRVRLRNSEGGDLVAEPTDGSLT